MFKFERWSSWLIGLSISFLAIFVVWWEVTHQYVYLAPDSFTYFNMARQWRDTGTWFSYSGVDRTTGVHLGYYLLLLPFSVLAGWDLPAWSFVINAICLGIGILLTGRGLGKWPAVVLSLGVLTPYSIGVVHSGVESSLAWLMICSVAYIARDLWLNSYPDKRQIFGLGLALGGLMVARLDLVFLVLSICALLTGRWWQLRHPKSFQNTKLLARDLIYLGLPIILFGTAIGIINYLVDGSPVPISGQLKSSFPVPAADFWKQLWSLKLFTAAALGMGTHLVVQWRSCKTLDNWQLAVWLGCLGLWSYNGLFASGIGAWYGVLPLYGILITAASASQVWVDHWQSSINQQRLMKQTAILITACTAIVIWHTNLDRPDWIAPHRAAAAFIKTHAQPGEAGAEFKDGVFAYYAPIPIFSLTGLANNQRYAQAARQNTYEKYFRERAIKYIIKGEVASGLQIPGAISPFKECQYPIFDNRTVRIFNLENCVFNTN